MKSFGMGTKDWLLRSAAALVALLLLSDAATAQAVIRGTLLDDRTELPVAGGTINLLNDRLRIVMSAQTDEEGRFELRAGRDGWYVMRSQRQGYLNASAPRMELVEGDSIEIEFRIAPDAVLLAPITVTATARRWWEESEPIQLWSFFERMDHFNRLGQGRFLLREDLAPYDGSSVRNMLAQMPGVRMAESDSGIAYPTLRAASAILRPCQPEYFVDGVRVRMRSPLDEEFDHGDTIDGIVSVSQLVAVEIYSGAAQLPGEFGGLNSNCGVVAVWTGIRG